MQIMDLEYNALKAYQRLHRFNASGAALNIALAAKNVPAALTQVFTKLYTLRNQIIHGGATYNSQINREQLKDACYLLSTLISLIIALMMSVLNPLWGDSAVYFYCM